MKSRKPYTFYFLILLSVFASAQDKDKKNHFYSDTTIASNGYLFGLKDTYVRKNLFMRTTVVVTNPTAQFLLIDKDNILISSQHLKNAATLYFKTIVVPPGETIEFPLKFTASDYQSPNITLNFTGLKTTNNIKVIHDEFQMNLQEKNEAGSGGIRITIVKTELKEEGLAVRVRIQYKGDYFMKQNIYTVGLLTPNNEPCLNFRKYNNNSYMNPSRNNELRWLLFPRECALLTKPSKRMLVFKDVFTEYDTQTVPEIKVSIRYLPDLDKNVESEKEKERSDENEN